MRPVLVALALAWGLASPAVALANSAPTITPSTANVVYDEGRLAVTFGTASDPDGDTLTFGASMGLIEPYHQDGFNWRWETSAPDGPFNADVTVTADDGNGHVTSAMFHLTVNNLPPLISLSGPLYVPSHSASPREFLESVGDVGDDTFSYALHCGNAAPLATGPTELGGQYWFTCAFNSPGTYQVGVTAQDSDGGSSQQFLTVTATPKVLSAADGYLRMFGDQQYQRFGGTLAVSDMNGDGFDDLAIGHGKPEYDQNDFSARSVFVLLGGAHSGTLGSNDLVSPIGFRITGAASEIYLGNSLSTAGDFNGDGFGDIVIGSSRSETGFKGAYVVYGTASPTNVDLTNLSPSQGLILAAEPVGFAVHVAGGGDINGDGLDDLVVIGADADGNTAIVFGGATGPSVDLTADPAAYGALLTGASGRSVALGDVNGDGLADIVISADYPGKMRVVFGRRGLGGTINVTTMTSAVGASINTGLRYSTNVIGDLNGDGIGDIVNESYGWSAEANDWRDQIQVYKGGTSLSSTPWWHFIAPHDVNAAYGPMAVADWNGDGFEDLAVGNAAALDAAGSVWVIPGAAQMGTVSMSDPTDWTRIDGDARYDKIGQALAFGNFDNDNKSELAIGAPDFTDWVDELPFGEVSLIENPAADAAPPRVFPPGATVLGGTRLTATPRIRLSWPAARDSGGVAKYILQLKRNSGTWTNVTLSDPMARHVDLSLKSANSIYRARLRAVDSAGHKSAWALGMPFGIRTAQENSSLTSFSGTWTRIAQTGASGGYVRASSTAGDKATVTFYVMSAGVVATTGPSMGMARISIDGVFYRDIDLYAPKTGTAVIAFATPLASTSHTLTIEVLSAANPSATGHQVRVDAFVFLN